MATDFDPAAHSIIAVGSAVDRKIALVAFGRGSPANVFEALLGAGLRDDDSELPATERAWIIETLDRGDEVRFIELQTDVLERDLEFFLRHWRSQFASLVHYPPEMKKPGVTSDAGLKAQERLQVS